MKASFNLVPKPKISKGENYRLISLRNINAEMFDQILD